MQKLQNNLKIGISALGLIGGSLFKSLKNNGFKNIYTYTQNDKTISSVIAEGFYADKNIEILKDCDLIFVCNPISVTAQIVKNIWAINPNAIIADVASLKADILAEIENTTTCKFIGSHPMAGTENSGFEASFDSLFNGAKWVLTPSKHVTEEEVNLLKLIIKTTGAIPLIMDAKEHDKAVALISHTPMLLAQALMNSAMENNSALKLASSGFRDMTRLALSNKVMANDMLNLNKENIQKTLQLIIQNANKLLAQDYFAENIDKIIESRKNLYNAEGKNIY